MSNSSVPINICRKQVLSFSAVLFSASLCTIFEKSCGKMLKKMFRDRCQVFEMFCSQYKSISYATALVTAELPPFFPLSRRSPKGEDGKPFPGIYLFALQIDKCHSSFKKVPIQKLIIKIFTDLPVLGTEPISKDTTNQEFCNRLFREKH